MSLMLDDATGDVTKVLRFLTSSSWFHVESLLNCNNLGH